MASTSTSGKIPKHLPKRVRNESRKNRRHASWLRGKERKEMRRKANEERHRKNMISSAPKTWESRELARRAAWLKSGREPVARTSCGNIVRDDGSVESCCNSRKRDRFGNRVPCVHFELAKSK